MGPASKRPHFPWPVLVLCGSGALLVREACVRWGTG
jgi:hypothetical protein